MAGVDIGLSQGYGFGRTQEVEEGTADTNCRASRLSRTRPQRAVSSTRGIQQYNRVTERDKEQTPSGSPGRARSPGTADPGLEGGPRSRIRDPRSPALPGGTCGHTRPAQSAGR